MRGTYFDLMAEPPGPRHDAPRRRSLEALRSRSAAARTRRAPAPRSARASARWRTAAPPSAWSGASGSASAAGGRRRAGAARMSARTSAGSCWSSASAAAARACSPACSARSASTSPSPRCGADDTNPRGFGEPRWAVDFHQRLLRQRRVTVNDARARTRGSSTVAAADDDAVRAELRDWLAGQIAAGRRGRGQGPAHRSGSCRCGRAAPTTSAWRPRFVTMLRHPAEILASAAKSYGDWQTAGEPRGGVDQRDARDRAATRGERRAFVRYEELLADWPRELGRARRAARRCPCSRASTRAARSAQVDEFVDPTLHRNRIRWDELDVPAGARDGRRRLGALQPLARARRRRAETHARLDAARVRRTAGSTPRPRRSRSPR